MSKHAILLDAPIKRAEAATNPGALTFLNGLQHCRNRMEPANAILAFRCCRLAITLVVLLWIGSGHASATPSCLSDKPDELAAWIAAQPDNISHEGRTVLRRLPAGNSVDVVLNVEFTDNRSYRGIVKWREPRPDDIAKTPEPVPASEIWSHAIGGDEDPITKAGNTWAKRGSTLVSFNLPRSFESVGREVTIAFAACKAPGAASGSQDKDQTDFAVTINAPTSARWFCISLALAVVGLSYLAAAVALSRIQKRAFSFDPVVLTAGWDGRGSPAKLQMLFFSLIVAGLLTYILSRAGLLSNLSATVLFLLGISSLGALGARATDISKNRLEYNNWTWLVRKKYLTIDGLAGQCEPRWADLLMVQGEFDVSRFQVVVFSVVVGGALLQIGLTDLATFAVPDALLGLLGLSQVTYLFGKAVGKNGITELDTAIEALRALEDAFASKAGTTDGPAPVLPGVLAPPPADLSNAKLRAKAEYDAYTYKEEDVRTMLEGSFGLKFSKKEPRFI